MTDDTASQAAPTLARRLGLGALVLYGIGDMLGSGIYALIGKAAGLMGNAIWLAFLVSMGAALLTALTYACLGSRYPRAAGAAYVAQRAFGQPALSYIIGLMVLASGLTSMATQSRAFANYFSVFSGTTPQELLIVGFLCLLTVVNLWGIRESSWLNALCTSIEVSGLLIVIAVGFRYWGTVNYWDPTLASPASSTAAATALTPMLILQGAVLTFYSFIGFEDMINVVEEVREPRRTFPRAIVLAMGGVTLLYLGVAITAVSVVPARELAASSEPLVEVVRRASPGFPPLVFSGIALFAITNTALLNYIMGSRLAYGMACQGLLPDFLKAIHPRRHTPHWAILTLFVVVLVLGLTVNITPLAKATSVLLMAVFIVLNAALLVLKRRPDEPLGAFEVPAFVPVGGIIMSGLILAHAKAAEVKLALLLLAVICGLYLLMRPRGVSEETFVLPEE